MDRRTFVVGSMAGMMLPSSAFAQAAGLADLYQQLENNPTLVENSWRFSERTESKGVGRGTPSSRKLSKNAEDMIVRFEVTSPGAYSQRYQRPIWPKGQSGVTIGVGYDLRYANRAFLDRDWPTMSAADKARLVAVLGLAGPAAEAAIPSVKSVVVPWPMAEAQFRRFLPYPTKETETAFPNCANMPDDCFGALVSLIYNRGSAMPAGSDRRREMREIRTAAATRAFDRIPPLIRRMQRLWPEPDARGLIIRREAEARLFESGLSRKA